MTPTNTFHKKTVLLILLMVSLSVTACSSHLPGNPEGVPELNPTLIQQAATPNILLITAVTLPTRNPNLYPEDAEGVVIAFLTAYQSDQEGMEQYLSKALRKKVPEGGPGMLLQFRDLLEGYAVTAVAVNQQPPAAAITVAVKIAGTVNSIRKFSLVQEDEKWVINGIEIPKKSK